MSPGRGTQGLGRLTAAQFLLAAVGVLVAVHGRGRRPFVVPLAAAWLGAGGMLGASVLDLPEIAGYATSVVMALSLAERSSAHATS